MYPTISHLLFDLFGINIPLPIQTFGFWVAIAFLSASYIISIELKRKEEEGHLTPTNITKIIGKKLSVYELSITLITGFLLGFKIIEAFFHYSDLVANPQNFILSTRGNLIGGILIAGLSLYLKWNENQKSRLATPKEIQKTIHPFELVGNMTMIAAVSGIIGAKIFHNLENMGAFLADPIGQLMAFSGLTFYGGLIAGAISVIWYTKKYGVNTRHLIDSAAPALMLAYGVGRIGCQMSGDGDWGISNLDPKPEWMSFLPDWMWSFTFPHNVINAGIPMPDCGAEFWEPYCYQLANPVWPTAFYETVLSLLIFGILWSIRKQIKVPGVLFFIYLVFNGIERFLIEKVRINTEYHILGGITQAEIISSCLIMIGITGVSYLYKYGNTN
ncbi:prolipoprotein diacylglyceryl transferase [Flavobacteriales bacterium]|nr:prolipoprotein diacylglyceryl transferase [Flavobacteriales bacterium]